MLHPDSGTRYRRSIRRTVKIKYPAFQSRMPGVSEANTGHFSLKPKAFRKLSPDISEVNSLRFGSPPCASKSSSLHLGNALPTFQKQAHGAISPTHGSLSLSSTFPCISVIICSSDSRSSYRPHGCLTNSTLPVWHKSWSRTFSISSRV